MTMYCVTELCALGNPSHQRWSGNTCSKATLRRKQIRSWFVILLIFMSWTLWAVSNFSCNITSYTCTKGRGICIQQWFWELVYAKPRASCIRSLEAMLINKLLCVDSAFAHTLTHTLCTLIHAYIGCLKKLMVEMMYGKIYIVISHDTG